LARTPCRFYKEYSADIHNSGVHLLNLINEILDLSRIEAGRYELNEEAVLAGARRCRLPSSFETGAPPAAASPSMRCSSRACRGSGATNAPTRQIVLNLLSNSIKFTPQGRRDLAEGRLDRVRADNISA